MASSNARLQERLDALEDEVELLKTEIKQTLIDMREAMLQRSDVLSIPRNGENTQESAVVDALPEVARPVEVREQPVASPVVASASNVNVTYMGLDLSADQANKFIVNDVLEWMGTAKEKGVTAARLFPILEAYENSGMVSPLMSRFIMKNMSMLDEIGIGEGDRSISPADFSSTLSDLHKLVCNSIDSLQ